MSFGVPYCEKLGGEKDHRLGPSPVYCEKLGGVLSTDFPHFLTSVRNWVMLHDALVLRVNCRLALKLGFFALLKRAFTCLHHRVRAPVEAKQ